MAASRRRASRLLGLLLILMQLQRAVSASKGVTASLKAEWPTTPPLLETSEFIGEDGEDKFWKFVDTVKELTVYKKGESVRSYYHLILKKAGQFLSDLQVSLLKFSLSLRVYSPAVHAFQQIASDEPPPDTCSAFVSVHGQRSCSAKNLKKLLKGAADRPKPYLYEYDHTYPGVNGADLPVVILYAEIGTKQFNAFHKTLSEKAEAGKLIYVLRHFVAEPKKQRMLLSGYGVELVIKSAAHEAAKDADVKGSESVASFEEDVAGDVQGFLFGRLRESHPELREQLGELRRHLLVSADDTAPLKVWELQDLSFQAATRIVSAPKFESLKLMRDLGQNFPSKARSLTRVAVSREMRKEIEENQKQLNKSLGIQPGDTNLYINGIHIDLDLHNLFSILDVVRGEAKLLEGLHNLGITGTDSGNFLRIPVTAVEDGYALDVRHPAIMWVNNIETDSTYQNWPSSVQELLGDARPGAIRQIRRNFFSLVLLLDPVQEDGVKLVKLAELLYKRKIPLRIGFVFVVDTDEKADGSADAGVAFLRSLNYIAEEYDATQAFMSMVSMYNEVDIGGSLSVETVTAYLKKTFPKADAAEILGADSSYDDGRKDGAVFHRMSGLGALPAGLFNGVPLSPAEMHPDALETVLLRRIADAADFFQRAVFAGEISEGTDVVDFLMERPNVVPRFNPFILDSDRRYLDFTASPVTDDWDDPTTFSFLDSKDKTAVVSKRMKYLTKHEEATVYGVTFWVVADIEQVSGRQILLNALKHMTSGSSRCRVGVINNPADRPTEDNSRMYRAVWASFVTQSAGNTLDFTLGLLEEDAARLLAQGTKMKDLLVEGMDRDAFEKKFNTMELGFLHSQRRFCQEVLKVKAGQSAVVSNGRVLGPLAEGEDLGVDDFHLLEKLALGTSADKIEAEVKQTSPTPKNACDLIMKVDALLSAAPKTEARRDLVFEQDKHSVLDLSPREDEVFFDAVATVDPLARDALKLAPLLIVLGQVVNMRVRLFMNCKAKLSEMPLKSFYRFVADADVSFSGNDAMSPGPVARFTGIPESSLFALKMITPESWTVKAVPGPYDLDNIDLREVGSMVDGEFELESPLPEGHCSDPPAGRPPRGPWLGAKEERLLTADPMPACSSPDISARHKRDSVWKLASLTHGHGTRDLFCGDH